VLGVKKKVIALATLFALLLSMVAGIEIVKIAMADPFYNVPVPHIGISNPPPQSIRIYMNSTVELEIYVNLFIDSPQLERISYSLDGGTMVDIEDFTVKSVTDFGPDKIDYKSYGANTTLIDLSEGTHTIVVYAGDLSTSRTFTVNSHYAVTVISVLSPTNQTYSGPVPLVFTVNGEIEEAHYYLYRGNYDAVFEGSFDGNTTLDLSIGKYVMHLYVTTEKGQATTSTYFSVWSSSTSESNYLVNPPLLAVSIMAIIVLGVGVGLLVYFKKMKR